MYKLGIVSSKALQSLGDSRGMALLLAANM